MVGVLIFYAVTGFLILPPILRSVAVKQLSRQLDRDVSIEKVRVNPFVLSTTIRGLMIRDKDGQPFVSWDEVYVNFQLASFLGHSWVFKEVSTIKPFVRVQMNKDYTFNFSDLITKFSTNAPPKEPSKPLALRIERLRIAGATASLTDLTPRMPFKRVLGPLDVTLEHFRTDPDSRNPYSFSGVTDGGEKFAWNGYFSLDPLRSQGELSLENLSLNKYAPLYQDLVRFEIKDGIVDIRSAYRFEWSVSNRVAAVTNASFALHSFKLAAPGSDTDIVELPEFSVTGASVDVSARRAEVASVSASGARLLLQRDKSRAINVVELSKPAESATHAPGGVLFLLRSVTNAVALLLNSSNAWAATVHDVNVRDCALTLSDSACSRPVMLSLDRITLTATNISNLPGGNLTAGLSLRWNTNGSIRTGVSASFLPLAADIALRLDAVELRPLDPYLEPWLNVFITDSKLGMEGRILLRTTNTALPEVTFSGDVRLDDFSTVDGVLGEDLLKWGSLRFSGIEANLNPPAVAIRQIAVDNACARLVIETNRTINLLAALRRDDTNAPVHDEPGVPAGARPSGSDARQGVPGNLEPANEALPRISIATVVISNAQVRFEDRSVTPKVDLTVQQAGGAILGLSSEEFHHADVDLRAKVDNVGPVEITGTINPFSGHLTNELKIAVRNVDLTPTSPYSGKFAGYRIAKGKLNLTLSYHLIGRNLKSENLVTLDQFTFGDKVDSPEATKLPVRLAIAILKDRNGRIELDVPIEGSLDDPQFRLHKVVVRALVNILTKVATSPFSLLGSVFGGKGEEIRYQDFVPGTAELPLAGKDKLDALVNGLYERPALQLEIEGSVDLQADRDGLRRGMLEKQLRTEKWLSLRKPLRATTTSDQVSLTAEERLDFIQKLYGEAVSKGRIDPTLTNTPGPVSSVKSGRALATATVTRSSDTRKGATVLLTGSQAAGASSQSATGKAVPGGGGAPAGIEAALLGSIAVGDADFEALAAARAKAVRAYVLQTGKVEPERLFLKESQSGAVKAEGARTYLQFQ
jgi:hypothetical protein